MKWLSYLQSLCQGGLWYLLHGQASQKHISQTIFHWEAIEDRHQICSELNADAQPWLVIAKEAPCTGPALGGGSGRTWLSKSCFNSNVKQKGDFHLSQVEEHHPAKGRGTQGHWLVVTGGKRGGIWGTQCAGICFSQWGHSKSLMGFVTQTQISCQKCFNFFADLFLWRISCLPRRHLEKSWIVTHGRMVYRKRMEDGVRFLGGKIPWCRNETFTEEGGKGREREMLLHWLSCFHHSGSSHCQRTKYFWETVWI